MSTKKIEFYGGTNMDIITVFTYINTYVYTHIPICVCKFVYVYIDVYLIPCAKKLRTNRGLKMNSTWCMHWAVITRFSWNWYKAIAFGVIQAQTQFLKSPAFLYIGPTFPQEIEEISAETGVNSWYFSSKLSCLYIYIYIPAQSWAGRVFTNGSGYCGSIRGWVIPATKKKVYDAA